MNDAISRAELIRGKFKNAIKLVRPPYSLPEAEFAVACDRCDACVEACPTHVISKDTGGYPVLQFKTAACEFCGACSEACPTGALDQARARQWNAIAEIKSSCLSLNGITCRSCDEICEAGAIRFQLMTEGRALPLVDSQRCTGCGACAMCCPNNSIEVRYASTQEVYA